jgi:RNA polymerase sigma-70 factor (ECF subfamily)
VTDPGRDPQSMEKGLDVEAVFRTELDYVAYSLRRLGIRPNDIEDAAHDVFIILHRKRDEFDTARPIRPWLFGIAMRVASARHRRAHVRRELPSETIEEQPMDAELDEKLDRDRRMKLVIEALSAIQEGRREVFILHDLDGVSMPDIAEALAIPLNTGYSRLRLARREFDAAVARLTRSPHEGGAR